MQLGVRKISIDKDYIGQRVDNFLLNALPGVPKSRIYRLLRRGEVRVNGGRKKPTYRVAYDDTVRIPPIHIKSDLKSGVPQRRLEQINESIIFENDH